MMYKDKAIEEMKRVFAGVQYGIDHTLRVLENAEAIMDGEGIEGPSREMVAITAILHDIGAIEAQRKYGSMDPAHQEKEGPIIAREILGRIGYPKEATDRVCHIIGNHHTPSMIDGSDFRIQWEADLLENLPYMDLYGDKDRLAAFIRGNFLTTTGTAMAKRHLTPTD